MLPAAAVLSLPAVCADILVESAESTAYELAGLRQLHLDSDSDEYKKGKMIYPCLPLLLTWAKNLILLDAYLGSKPFLVSLTHIKHLILVIQDDDIGNVFRALPRATKLETLSISRSKPPTAHRHIHAPLGLDMLQCLTRVALRSLCPETVSLPEDCKLSLHEECFNDLKGKVWQGKEAVLRSVSTNCPANCMSALREYIGNLHSLVSVAIDLTTSYRSDSVRTIDLRCLEHVKRVHVSGTNLDISVPTEVSWDVLEFHASDTLRLINTGGLMHRVPNFSATFRAAVGVWIAEMPGHLATLRIPWGMNGEASAGSREKYRLWYALVRYNQWCCCGACLDCLVAEGKAVRPK